MRLAGDPRPGSARPLKGSEYKGIWKLRSGDYRILYRIQDEILVVLVILVGDRKDVYDRLKRLLR